jgi:hypothetical protein
MTREGQILPNGRLVVDERPDRREDVNAAGAFVESKRIHGMGGDVY